jgi:hypothetical protein
MVVVVGFLPLVVVVVVVVVVADEERITGCCGGIITVGCRILIFYRFSGCARGIIVAFLARTTGDPPPADDGYYWFWKGKKNTQK